MPPPPPPPKLSPRESLLMPEPVTSTYVEARAAYRRWLLLTHPDKGGQVGLFQAQHDAWVKLLSAPW